MNGWRVGDGPVYGDVSSCSFLAEEQLEIGGGGV